MDIDFTTRIHLTDGTHATVADVVVDPYHLAVTHLALCLGSPHPTRLVPIEDVRQEAGTLRLDRDTDGFDEYPAMNAMSYVRIAEPIDPGPDFDIGITDVLTLPYYEAELGVGYPLEQTVSWHRVPVGEVEIRRRSRVTTSDLRDVGHVEGFVTDEQRAVTHVLVDHRHLFGHRDLLVPLAAVAHVDNDHVTLALTRDQVRDLPRADVRSWWDRHRPGRRPPADFGSAPEVTRPARGTFHPDPPRADHPGDDGIAIHDPDSAHDEACHLLANDAAPTLLRDGLSRTEVWEWCEAFLEARGHGDVDELVEWIRARQHQDVPAR